jgi:hypothetical protein
MAKMTEDDLLRYVDEEARSAFHYVDGDLASERKQAIKAYMREPYGNEEEGRSAFVASDVFDAVEGVLPDLIDIFVSSDKAVVFEPVGPEDAESAEQVTNACNYVFYKQNNGFLILYTAIKDALLLKTGGVKWYWEKKRTPVFTRYQNVEEMQLAVFLSTNPKAEVIEQEEVQPPAEELALHQQQYALGAAQGIEIPPLPRRFNVKIKTVEEKGKVCISNVPPDELRVSARHNSILLDNCAYVAHVVEKTYSDILEMGFDVTVDEVKAAKYEETTADYDYRTDSRGTRWGRYDDENEQDDSMVRGFLREEYVLVDYDGDGIAERRRIVRLGQKILENKECSHVPMAMWTPVILTHQFGGISLADLVLDFQRVTTEIWRQQLDNLYLANNQETVVLTDGSGNPLVNIDDLLNRRPGGVIREKSPGAVRQLNERWVGIQAQPMLEQMVDSKASRTGWTKYSQGLDANSLNKTATGVSMIMSASQKRMKLTARIIAECLVAPMFRGILKTLTDYGMEKISMRLNGKFVEYDPQEWRDGYDMSINVGIGSGDKQQQLIALQGIAQAQSVIAGSPLSKVLLDPKNIFNTQARIVEAAGFKNAEEFWTDPEKKVEEMEPEQEKPDPQALAAQAKMKDDQQRTEAQFALERMKLEQAASEKEKDRELQRQLKAMEIAAAQQQTVMKQDMAAQQDMLNQIAQGVVMLTQRLNGVQ